MAVMSLKVPDDLRELINEAAGEDCRKQQDEVRYLLKLGLDMRLRLRDQQREVLAGKTQIDPEFVERMR